MPRVGYPIETEEKGCWNSILFFFFFCDSYIRTLTSGVVVPYHSGERWSLSDTSTLWEEELLLYWKTINGDRFLTWGSCQLKWGPRIRPPSHRFRPKKGLIPGPRCNKKALSHFQASSKWSCVCSLSGMSFPYTTKYQASSENFQRIEWWSVRVEMPTVAKRVKCCHRIWNFGTSSLKHLLIALGIQEWQLLHGVSS